MDGVAQSLRKGFVQDDCGLRTSYGRAGAVGGGRPNAQAGRRPPPTMDVRDLDRDQVLALVLVLLMVGSSVAYAVALL